MFDEHYEIHELADGVGPSLCAGYRFAGAGPDGLHPAGEHQTREKLEFLRSRVER